MELLQSQAPAEGELLKNSGLLDFGVWTLDIIVLRNWTLDLGHWTLRLS